MRVKMLGWPNTYALNSRYLRLLRLGDKRLLRRRNRAREVEAVQREVSAIELTCVEPGCHPRFYDSYWSMNDDCQAPTAEVWRALIENECGLREVDFDGTYVTESEKL